MRVLFLPHPWTDESLAYQRYYVTGLARRVRVSVPTAPAALRALPIGALLEAWPLWTARRPAPAARGFDGQYLFVGEGAPVRVVIDARDAHDVRSPELLHWCDLYFKANSWPHVSYDPKVRPIVNGNGRLAARDIRRLRALRDAPRTTDVAFISVVNSERDLELFEELQRSRVRKDLLAVVGPGPQAEAWRARLEKVGVPVADKYIPRRTLWSRLAAAEVVVLRAGRHLCLPWRTIDLLALGACLLLDDVPVPLWPEPLRSDVHFAHCGLRHGDPQARGVDLSSVRPRLEALVADAERRRAFRAASASYFDTHAAPERVADYVLGAVRASSSSR